MLPLNDLMATSAKRNQVVNMIGGHPVAIELAPGFYVMNVQSLAKFFLGDAASLASKTISFAGSSGLCTPVVASPLFVPTQPSAAICAGCIARFSLPLESAFGITERILFDSARMAANYLAAIVAWSFYPFFVLRMGRANDVLAAPSGFTFYGAEAVVCAFNAMWRASNEFATDRAWHLLASSSDGITASSRAAFLLGVIARWQEHIAAMLAGLFFALPLVLIATRDRAEFHRSVSPRLDRFMAVLTSIHISIIA